MKLFTTAVALSRLKPDYHFTTRIMRQNDDLIIIGDGDPGFGDTLLLEQNSLDLDKLLRFMVNEITKQNITHIDTLIVDDRVFDQQFTHPHWPEEQLNRHYCAQVAGINFNNNCLNIYATPNAPGIAPDITTIPVNAPIDLTNLLRTTTDPKKHNALNPTRMPGTNRITVRGHIRVRQIAPVRVTINDPPIFFAQLIKTRLAEKNVNINHIRRAASNESFYNAVTIAEIKTPITEILKRANRDSVNLFAEALLKRVGLNLTGQSGSWSNGAAAMRSELSKMLGPEAALIVIDDGSGLSKQNLATPELITRLLLYMHRSPLLADAFRNSLASGGVSGTLKKRFRNINFTNNQPTILAKSGTINHVVALSGYITNQQRDYAFSIILNNHKKSAAKARNIIDLIVGAINNDIIKLNSRKQNLKTNTPAAIN